MVYGISRSNPGEKTGDSGQLHAEKIKKIFFRASDRTLKFPFRSTAYLSC